MQFVQYIENFEEICSKVRVCGSDKKFYKGEIENPHEEPVLFLVFDEQEKNVLSKKEAEDLNKLLAVPKSQTLIVGKHNRCAKRSAEFEYDVEVVCVNLDTKQDGGQGPDLSEELNPEEILKIARETEGFKEWSPKCLVWKGLLAVLLLTVGGFIVRLAGNWADKWIFFDKIRMVYVKRPWWQISGPMILHLLGSGVCTAGVLTGYYLAYDLVTPRGFRYFYKEYGHLWAAGWAVIAALTMPHIFWEISWDVLCQLLGMRHWMAIDRANVISNAIVHILGNSVFLLWFGNILWFQKYRWKLLDIAGRVLLTVSCAYMVFQTLGNNWELILFGLLLCAAGCLIGRTMW